jgi:hypothetical protein
MMDKKKTNNEEVAEKNINPTEKDEAETDEGIKTVHDQINDAYNQGTVDEKKDQDQDQNKK